MNFTENPSHNGLNPIEEILKKNISDSSVHFVFPTQIAADLWADRAIFITERSAVASERFIAWDDFKSSFVKSKKKDRTAIPAALRKIFAALTAKENADSPFFKNIINENYAEYSNSFSSWISRTIPGLEMWKKLFEKTESDGDDEDKDLLELYGRYKEFLDENSLFEPAWEEPPFTADGNHYFVFFPEILADYYQYRELLEKSSEFITVVNIPFDKEEIESSVDFFSDARTELKNLCLKIREIHKTGVSYENICISVPDLESYGPYVERELSLYGIPYITKYSKPLTSFGAGTFFEQVLDCVSNNFSFSSLKALLFNGALPWIRPELNEALINFGMENNCLCSFEESAGSVDVWQKSFSERNPSADIQNFYLTLKRELKNFVDAKNFTQLRERYFKFRSVFFDMEKVSRESDLIMSRCITELSVLTDVEKNFSSLFTKKNVPSPFSFFAEYISEKSYLEQQTVQGVQILPFKAACCAPFDWHITIDAGQSALSETVRQIPFLREDKRKSLLGGKNYEDPVITKYFLRCYILNSVKIPAYFSCASKTFTGYAEPVSFLTENDFSKPEYTEKIYEKDIYFKEKSNILKISEKGSIQTEEKQKTISETQFEGFKNWSENQYSSITENLLLPEKINIPEKNGMTAVSPTLLNAFFLCRRKWILRNSVHLRKQAGEAVLMDQFALGNLNHKILELFCNSLKEKNLPLCVNVNENGDEEIPLEYREILKNSVNEAITREDSSFIAGKILETIRDSIFEKMTATVTAFSKEFAGASVVNTEKYLTFTDEKNSVFYNGKTDCLLYDIESDSYILIDFKSTAGAVPKNLFYEKTEIQEKDGKSTVIEEIPDFQMPFYIFLLKNQEKPVEVSRWNFFSISDCKFFPSQRSGKNTPESLYETVQKMSEFVKQYAEFAAKAKEKKLCEDEITFSNDFETCNSCEYRAVCRNIFNVGKPYGI